MKRGLVSASTHEVILEPGRADRNYWGDLWRYRELFQVLAWRDIAIRYRQTAIGVAWAVIRPLLTMVIFTVLFGRWARMPGTPGVPYSVMVLAGLLPWTFFSAALADASNSLVSNSTLISKVYFPRMIVPAATIVAALVDFGICLVIMAVIMAINGFMPDWRLLLLPVFTLMAFAAALGPSLWITAMNVRYRDFRYIVPFVVQFGLYVSPIGYSAAVVPAKWRLLYELNPIVGVVNGFRWCLLRGQAPLDAFSLGVSLAVIALALWAGVRQFRRLEKSFADLI